MADELLITPAQQVLHANSTVYGPSMAVEWHKQSYVSVFKMPVYIKLRLKRVIKWVFKMGITELQKKDQPLCWSLLFIKKKYINLFNYT